MKAKKKKNHSLCSWAVHRNQSRKNSEFKNIYMSLRFKYHAGNTTWKGPSQIGLVKKKQTKKHFTSNGIRIWSNFYLLTTKHLKVHLILKCNFWERFDVIKMRYVLFWFHNCILHIQVCVKNLSIYADNLFVFNGI